MYRGTAGVNGALELSIPFADGCRASLDDALVQDDHGRKPGRGSIQRFVIAIGPGSQLDTVRGVEHIVDHLSRARNREVLDELGTPEGTVALPAGPGTNVREVEERQHEGAAHLVYETGCDADPAILTRTLADDRARVISGASTARRPLSRDD